MPVSRSSRDGSSGSLVGSVGTSTGGPVWGRQILKVFRNLLDCPEQLIQQSPFIEAQAIRLIRRDSSQVFSSSQECPSTKPYPPATPTVWSDQSGGSQISSSHCSFRCLGSVCKRNREYRVRMSSLAGNVQPQHFGSHSKRHVLPRPLALTPEW